MTDGQGYSEADKAVDQAAEQDGAAGERVDDAQETAIDAHVAEGEDDTPADNSDNSGQ